MKSQIRAIEGEGPSETKEKENLQTKLDAVETKLKQIEDCMAVAEKNNRLEVLENLKASVEMGRLQSLTFVDCDAAEEEEALLKEIKDLMEEKGFSYKVAEKQVLVKSVSVSVSSFLCLSCRSVAMSDLHCLPLHL